MKAESKVAGRVLVPVLIGLALQSGICLASEDARIASFHHRYNILKTEAIALLESLRRARREGHTAGDRKPLLHLRKDVMDFCFEVQKYVHLLDISAATRTATSEERSTLLPIAYSCDAMEQVLEAEFDVQRSGSIGKSDMLLQIQDKYEEVWEVADSAATGASKSALIEKR